MNAAIVLGVVSVLVSFGFVVGFGAVLVIGRIYSKLPCKVKQVFIPLTTIPVEHKGIEIMIPAIYTGIGQDVIVAHGCPKANLLETYPGVLVTPEEFLRKIEDELSLEVTEILFISCFPASKKAGQYKQWRYKFVGNVEEELYLESQVNGKIEVMLLKNI